jgi:preprotein translocase subunit SecG
MNAAWTNILIDVLLFFFVIDCAFMGLVIMMQRSKQEGLGAAFGGGITDSVWGAQTSQVLVRATVWAAIIFFGLSITLARLYSHRASLQGEGSSVQQQLAMPVATPAAPVTPVTPAPAASAPTASPAATSAAPVAPAPAATPAATQPATATPAKAPSK